MLDAGTLVPTEGSKRNSSLVKDMQDDSESVNDVVQLSDFPW